MSPRLPYRGGVLCSNCGRPATLYRATSSGDVLTCDDCIPGDATGEARPVVAPTADLGDRLTLSKAEAASVLGVSVDYFEKRVMPDLRVITKGGRVLIPKASLEAWSETAAARALRGR